MTSQIDRYDDLAIEGDCDEFCDVCEERSPAVALTRYPSGLLLCAACYADGQADGIIDHDAEFIFTDE